MDPKRLDANESAYFLRELEYIKSRLFNTKYKELRFALFIPVSTETPSGTESVTYRTFTAIGVAKIIANYAKDFPRIDIYGEEITKKVKDLGASYGFNVKEIRQAAITGRRLNPQRATFAQRAINQLHNKLAWFGDTDYSIEGLIDFPGISEYVIPVGASTFKTWSTKTPDEIIADLNGIKISIIDSTNGVERPNQILLPINQYELIASTRVTDGDTNTILNFFLSTNPGMSVDWLVELDGAGAGGLDRMLCYVRDPGNLEYDAPMIFEQLEEEKEGMERTVPVHGESAGVSVYYPASVAFGDGL